MSFSDVIYTLFSAPMRALYRMHIHGLENFPRDRGCIVCSNHTSRADTIAISAGLRCRPAFMAKKELFSVPVVKHFFKAMHAFPIDRGGADIKSIKYATQIVKDGGILVIFPQGTRCKYVDPKTTTVKGGAGMIAYRAGADVVPVLVKTAKHHVAPFRRTDVYCGKPISYEELGFENGGRVEYQAAADYIFEKICSLDNGDVK